MNLGNKQPASLDSLGFIDFRRVIETLLIPWAAEFSAFLRRIGELRERRTCQSSRYYSHSDYLD